MRRGLLALLVLGLAGCAHDHLRDVGKSTLARLKPKAPEPTPDIVQFQYVLIERDISDLTLTRDIWQEADEQVVAPEIRQDLHLNGLRLAKIGSRLSPVFAELMKDANPSGQGRLQQSAAGKPIKVQMTPAPTQFDLFTNFNRQMRGEKLVDAQLYLQAVPKLSGDSAVKLGIMPLIEFGPTLIKTVPTPELNGWQIKNEREQRLFTELKTEMTLNNGEYAVIGGLPDRRGTLGHQMFIKEIEEKQTQTVLVMRALRPTRSELIAAGYELDDFFLTPTSASAAPAPPIRLLAQRRDSDPIASN